MDATLRLGGENYVFWGGREGYHTLLNTDLKCAAPAIHPHMRKGASPCCGSSYAPFCGWSSITLETPWQASRAHAL